MAQLTVTVTYPDEKQADLRDTLCTALAYQDLIDGLPNPQSKGQFIVAKCQEFLSTWIRNTYKSEKNRVAVQSSEDLIVS